MESQLKGSGGLCDGWRADSGRFDRLSHRLLVVERINKREGTSRRIRRDSMSLLWIVHSVERPDKVERT